MNALQSVNRVASVITLIGSVALFGVAIALCWWALDRNPPFVMKSYETTPAAPGGYVFVSAKVERDVTRHCSTTFSRVFFDSKGTRYDLSEGAHFMNASALEEQNKMMPGKLVLSIKVPEHAAPGKAVLMTVLDYECNPVHMLKPIPVVLVMNLEVLP